MELELNTLIKDETSSITDTSRPYAVIMFNDDITPVEYVLLVLITAFDKKIDEAIETIENIQKENKSVVGIYGLDEAYKRTEIMDNMNREFGMCLLATVEET